MTDAPMENGADRRFLFLFSAGEPIPLEQYCAEVADWLEHAPARPDLLARLAHTLVAGRDAGPERLAVVASDRAMLLAGLRGAAPVFRGRAEAAATHGITLPDAHHPDPEGLEDIARQWVGGAVVRPGPGPHPARVALPVPPAATRPFWIGAPVRRVPPDRPGRRTLTGAEFYLRDHALGPVLVLPAVMALEFAHAQARLAGRAPVRRLANVMWGRPVLVAGAPADVEIEVRPIGDGTSAVFELRAGGHLSSTGTLDPSPGPARPPLDLDAIRARDLERVSHAEVYARFDELGGGYGPGLRGIRELRFGPGEALAEIAVPAAAESPAGGFGLHPSLLDAMLQTALWTAPDPWAVTERRLPFALRELEILGPLPEAGFAYARRTEEGHDLTLTDQDGQVRLTMSGVVTRPVPVGAVVDQPAAGAPPENPLGPHLLVQRWVEEPVVAAPRPERTVVLHHPELARALGAASSLPDDGPGDVIDGSGPLLVVQTGREAFADLVRVFRSWSARPDRPPLRVLALVEHPEQPGQAWIRALDGAFRVIAREDPRFHGSVVESPSGSVADLARVVRDEAATAGENQVRHRGGRRLVGRWEPVHRRPVPAGSGGASGAGALPTWLVTGGRGGLGREIVRGLAGRARFVLVGRSAGAGLEDLNDLRRCGADVVYHAGDLSVPGTAERIVADVHRDQGPIHGVLHLAGSTRDSYLLRKSDAEIDAVLGAKAGALEELDRATAGDPLDFFVAFSSMSGAAGSPGQADYAYANRYLDAYLEWRSRSGRPGRSLSLLWSLWAGDGLTVGPDPAAGDRLTREHGLEPMPPDAGVRLLGEILDDTLGVPEASSGHLLIGFGDLPALRALLASGPRPAQPAEPVLERAGSTAAREPVTDLLRTVLADVLGLPEDEVDVGTSFDAYGLDSLLVMDLTGRLEKTFGPLPKTLFFEYRDLRSLSEYFVAQHPGAVSGLTVQAGPAVPPGRDVAKAPAARSGASPDTAAGPEPIAIVGISVRFAGSPTMDAFWEHLRAGDDLVTEIPVDRWDWREHDHAGAADRAARYGRWGSFLEDVDRFDPLFFGISPREAEIVDPQERLFLETAWLTMEDAGYTPQSLGSRRVGVYAGAMYGLYQMHEADDGRVAASSHASIANRVSYTLGLEGPSLGVDTMCSSALTAIHLAVRDLRAGETEMAFAGGVNLHVHPYKYRFLGQGGFTSSDGRCRSFGADGDGYVPGEGVGAVLLKPLSAALRDGDRIHALVLGTGINHGGRTNGFTVPSPTAQADLLGRTLDRAGIDPGDLDYLEAHGTGTALGDPIEIRGLSLVLQASGRAPGSLPVGSVKSNIGHLESASGMAGLAKVLLQMRHRELVPSLHSEPPNPNIDWAGSPLRVQRETGPWTPAEGRPLRAGVSSFGAGGANAHVVLEEFVPTGPAREPRPGPWLFPVSAKTAWSLAAQVADLAAAVDPSAPATRIADIAWTLAQGRVEFSERLVVLAADAAQLRDRLRRAAQLLDAAGPGPDRPGPGEADARVLADGIWAGHAGPRPGPLVGAEVGAQAAAAAWVTGGRMDWEARLGPGRLRTGLPGYRFDRIRCWITERNWQPPVLTRPTTPAPDVRNLPLLERVEPSGPGAVVAHAVFAPGHPLVQGHRMGGLALLPGLAVLELVHAAARAGGAVGPSRFRSVRWLRPVLAGHEVRIELCPDGDGRSRFELTSDGLVLAEGVLDPGADPGAAGTVDPGSAGSPGWIRTDGAQLYGDLAAAGLDYGPALRGVRWLAAGPDEAMVRIEVPSAGEQFSDSYLHPTVLDSALHTLAGLRDRNGSAMLPFALSGADVYAPAPSRGYAHARPVGPDRYDITVLDDAGQVCVRLRDLALRPAPPAVMTQPADPSQAEGLMFVPRWVLRAPEQTLPDPGPGPVWLIAASESVLVTELAAHWRDQGRAVLVIPPAAVEDQPGEPGQAFVLPGVLPAGADPEADRRPYLLALLALVRRAHAPRRLVVVTQGALSAFGESVTDPGSAGLHGLALSVAQEYPQRQVAVLDLAADDQRFTAAAAVAADLAAGGPFALRQEQVHQRRFVPLASEPERRTAFRDGGGYVILGGAGGLGLELAGVLARGHQARVALVGRGELDAGRRRQIEAMDPTGELVSYHRVDARDAEALTSVLRSVRDGHGRLDGVVHATIVLADRSVARMSERDFLEVWEAKSRTALALGQALAEVPADLVVFFSSAVALSGSAGQGNYAAGAAFVDAYAHWLSDRTSARVSTIDWGYWGTVGIVADDGHRRRMRRAGFGSITPAEGLAALEQVAGQDRRQVLVIKAEPEVLTAAGVELGPSARLPEKAERSLDARPPVPAVPGPVVGARLDRLLLEGVWARFRAEGLFTGIGERRDEATLGAGLRVVPARRALFGELVRVLVAGGFLRRAGTELEAVEGTAEPDPDGRLAAFCRATATLSGLDRLVGPCLENLFPVLRGEVRATDVLFPGGSPALVEAAYTGSPVVDRANELVVAAVRAALGRHDGRRPFTVVEVGAGTGSTSALVLAAIAAAGVEAEYVYTDVSPTFVQHGRRRFAAEYPFARFRVLDVSAAMDDDDLPAGHADVVVAANVLHATADLLATLGAVGRLLRPSSGRLVLNEATSNQLTATVTFGLLDGWWVHRDPQLRLTGSPLLSVTGWRAALAQAGFGEIQVASADDQGDQHVVVAAAAAAAAGPGTGPVAGPVAEPVAGPVAAVGLVGAAQELVRDAFEEILGVPRERLWLDETFENFGIDSLTVTRIADRMAGEVGDLPATLLFEYPTIREIAEFLVRERPEALRPAAAPAPTGAGPVVRTFGNPVSESEGTGDATTVDPAPSGGAGRPDPAHPDRRIAVIGLAGRYPQAEDLEEFWANLRDGRDCVEEVPPERWDWRSVSPAGGRPASRWGGFLRGVDEFDPRFFRMTKNEADLVDPQERLFLQTTWHALEDAGYPRTRLRDQRVGVYVGVMYAHYQLLENEEGIAGGMGQSSIANRVSYFCDFRGPSLAVDTMCSSSLTAIQLACDALAAGTIDYAVAGGVNLAPHPRKYRQLAAGGFTSTDGRSRSFGADGDGMVPGEGVGAVLLKPLAQAEADGDRIHGVLLGGSLNHGGKVGGFSVPSPAAQAELIGQALRTAGVGAESVSYVEAHGTGTALGDPAEVAGLTAALDPGSRGRGRVALGSVKSSIGHLESAAGIAALTKVLLQLRAGELVPSLHAEELNPAVDWDRSVFVVQRGLAPWAAPFPRRAGISAFGAGGSNAHLLVQEHLPPKAVGGPPGPLVFPFSGRDETALREVLERFLAWAGSAGPVGRPAELTQALTERTGIGPGGIDRPLDELGLEAVELLGLADRRPLPGSVRSGIDLGAVAFTLQVGREALPHRVAVVAQTVDELLNAVRAYLANRPLEGTFSGTVAAEPERLPAPADPRTAARRFAAGDDLVWEWAGAHPAPLSLPGYPFARVSCWVTEGPGSPATLAPGAPCPEEDGAGAFLPAVLAGLARVTGFGSENIDISASFHDLGLDSLALIRLAEDLSGDLGTAVGPDQLLATPTARALASWLGATARTGSRPAPAAERPLPERALIPAPAGHAPVAVIGMAGRLPGAATLDGFWSRTMAGEDLIGTVPPERWDPAAVYGDPACHPDRTRIDRGGFIGGMDRFDPLFFGISPREARWMDPRQRLLMQTVWSALEDAGIDPSGLAGSDTGLFVGAGVSEYAEAVQRSGASVDAYAATGLSGAMLANRISFLLDLHGPSEAVDTACSSSLVALHHGVQAIRQGRCETVIVAGVSLLLSPVTFGSLERAGMLSPDGVGRAFDRDANGYVRGEGVGAVVLRRPDRARAEGNPVHALVRGVAVNHGGRANSLTAPNPTAQADVVVAAHRDAGISPDTVGLIETHGTGTVIGDPAEVNGLRQAFERLAGEQSPAAAGGPHRPPTALVALKNVIGHLEPAAGIAALLRTLLAMRHGVIPGNPNLSHLNPHLDLEDSPFLIPAEPRPWPSGAPRRAGISAFGYGGVNAHVVLEAPPVEVGPSENTYQEQVFVLSARDRERLAAYAQAFLAVGPGGLADLAAVTWTLQTGRPALAARLAFVARDGAEVMSRLRAFVAGDADDHVHTGRAGSSGPGRAVDAAELGAAEVAAAWANGMEVDWAARRRGAPRRLLSLPTYPFAAERYWFTEPGPAGAQTSSAAPEPLPPVPADVTLVAPRWVERARPVASGRPSAPLVLGGPGIGPVAAGGTNVRAGTGARPDHLGDYERAIREHRDRFGTVEEVIHAWALEDPGAPVTGPLGLESVYRTIQALIRSGTRPGRFQVLVPAGGPAEAYAGFGSSLRTLLPGTAFRVIQVGPGVVAGLLAEETRVVMGADMVRLVGGRREELVLEPCPGTSGRPSPLRSGGVYLLTGGLGGLGRILAADLLRRGGRVALVGRSRVEADDARLRDLSQLGPVEYYPADVTDRGAMRVVAERVVARWGGLTGVFHLAGTASRTPLPEKEPAEFTGHVRVHADGARVLDEVTRDYEPEAFVLFSSVAGRIGDYGLGDYAVGARLLDGFARERSGPALSVDWPMWRDGGMHVDPATEQNYLESTGFRYLESEEGLQILDRLLRGDQREVAVLPGDPDRVLALLAPPAPGERPVPVTTAPPSRRAVADVVGQLREEIGTVLELPPHRIDADAGFGEYGLDSFGLQTLTTRLNDRYGVGLSTPDLFGLSTVTRLAQHLAGQIAPSPAVPPSPASAGAATDPGDVDPAAVAVIGISARFPGAADVEEFWSHLVAGSDLITVPPASRWDPEEIAQQYDDPAGWGGFLDGIDLFDAPFFRMSPLEAQVTDPQHRLFLEHTWAALEDAGLRADRLAGRPVSVFAGVQFADYESLVLTRADRSGPVNPYASAGLARTMLANRVSYALDLHGPSETVDTACSSSLVAVHRAVRSLRSGESELAIAGGVNLVLSAQSVVAGGALGVLSPNGRCRTLDADADGYVKGEGVAVLVLKPLRQALADGDPVHAVIRGSAVNHGGRAASPTAPNPQAQADLLVAAYRDAGVELDSVSLLELHGTGTRLGDPVEIDGLTRAHRALTAGRALACGIGSVKSNLGHLEPASGVAGLVKAVLALRHRRIPPTLHLSRLNPLIRLEGTPFHPVTEVEDWDPRDQQGGPVARRAGVSSFGFGGVNAHVVLEEADSGTAPAGPAGGRADSVTVLVLSARDEAALARYAAAFAAFLDRTDADLAVIAHITRVGRVPMPARLAVTASTREQAVARLQAYLAGEPDRGWRSAVAGDEPGWVGLPAGQTHVAGLIAAAAWDDLVQLWLEGVDVAWPEATDRGTRRWVAGMPTYPFARERYWFDGSVPVPSPKNDVVEHVLADSGPDSLLLVPRWEPVTDLFTARPDAFADVAVIVRADQESDVRARLGEQGRVVVWPGSGAADLVSRLEASAAVVDLTDHGPAVPGPAVSELGQAIDWDRVSFLQELVARERAGLVYLHVTSGLVSFGRTPGQTGLRGAGVAALLRVLSAEHAGMRARTVDLDPGTDLWPLIGVELSALSGARPDPEISVRSGVRYRPVLRPVDPAPPRPLGPGPTLIMGGTGGLGRLVAGRLIERGCRAVVLLGRTPLPPRAVWDELLEDPGTEPALAGKIRAIRDLERPGVVVVVATPRPGPETLTAALEKARARTGPFTRIVHCAGVGDTTDPAFVAKRRSRMQAVAEPKIAGLAAVLTACADDPLEEIVLFSSVSGQVPALGVGISDYAMANAVLDRFAEHRTATGNGPRVLSIAWPSWRSGGMPVADTPVTRELGLIPLAARTGLDLFERARAGVEAVVLPLVTDREKFDAERLRGRLRPAGRPGPAVRDGVTAATAATSAAPARILAVVTDALAQTLRLDPARIGPDASFEDLGLNSIAVAQLVAVLERMLPVPVPPGDVLENPSPARLAAALAGLLPASESSSQLSEGPVPASEISRQTSADPVPEGAPQSSGAPAVPGPEPIAVVGLACHFPGAADQGTFWRNLRDGVDSVTEVDPRRWDASVHYRPHPQPGRSTGRWGGFLPGIENFDPEFFGLDPEQAAGVDPLIRQFLETTVECLADAGLAPGDVAGLRAGIFVGARSANFGARAAGSAGLTISGVAQNFIAAGVAQYLDVHGPALVIDSACSSALTAIHLGAASLRAGESDLVLAGGVEILLDEVPFVGMSQAGALSPTGRCRAFDERADGIVLGEGSGTLLLKRLSDAQRDGDRIYAVIEGSAVNNDGRTMGVTTPNPAAQRDVIARALDSARTRAAEIGYVEAHGTGTQIGDPLELKALTEVYRSDTAERAFCGIGSVKTNIGHTLSAAGIAGAIKVILSVWHGQLVPTLHCEQLNRRFRFEDSPFFPVRRAQDWPTRAGRRLGAVSSFGFGGTNAHVVFGQAPPAAGPVRDPLPAPQFRRRRYWFAPPPGASAEPVVQSVNGVGAVEPFFELRF